MRGNVPHRLEEWWKNRVGGRRVESFTSPPEGEAESCFRWQEAGIGGELIVNSSSSGREEKERRGLVDPSLVCRYFLVYRSVWLTRIDPYLL